LPIKKRFSVEQIVGVLKQAEVGVPVAGLIRKTGITEQTYYRWKARHASWKQIRYGRSSNCVMRIPR
jgi:DNA invertase Pin-like site-specific DNA recombinase